MCQPINGHLRSCRSDHRQRYLVADPEWQACAGGTSGSSWSGKHITSGQITSYRTMSSTLRQNLPPTIKNQLTFNGLWQLLKRQLLISVRSCLIVGHHHMTGDSIQRLRFSAPRTHSDIVIFLLCLIYYLYSFPHLRLPSTYHSTTDLVIWQPAGFEPRPSQLSVLLSKH